MKLGLLATVRALAIALRGFGAITVISVATPWILLPDGADWVGLGFGVVLAMGMAAVILGMVVLVIVEPGGAGTLTNVAVVLDHDQRGPKQQ